MKQKVVIKVESMKNHKLRSKALKVTVGCSGVEAVGFKGEEKDQIEVTGERLDAAELTTLLRKSVGHAELLSVGPVEEKKNEKKEETSKTEKVVWCFEGGVPSYPIHACGITHQYQDPYCSIM